MDSPLSSVQFHIVLTVAFVAAVAAVVSEVTHAVLGHTRSPRAGKLLGGTGADSHWIGYQSEGQRQPERCRHQQATVCPSAKIRYFNVQMKHVAVRTGVERLFLVVYSLPGSRINTVRVLKLLVVKSNKCLLLLLLNKDTVNPISQLMCVSKCTFWCLYLFVMVFGLTSDTERVKGLKFNIRGEREKGGNNTNQAMAGGKCFIHHMKRVTNT